MPGPLMDRTHAGRRHCCAGSAQLWCGGRLHRRVLPLRNAGSDGLERRLSLGEHRRCFQARQSLCESCLQAPSTSLPISPAARPFWRCEAASRTCKQSWSLNNRVASDTHYIPLNTMVRHPLVCPHHPTSPVKPDGRSSFARTLH
jgi:hypothetical protein